MMTTVHAAEIAFCAWVCLIALTALVTRPWRPRPVPSSLALRGEPPAVVSELARRLPKDGYAATLLDLAARGWFSMAEAEPGRFVCQIPAGQQDHGLTAYERAALAHVAFRARGMASVPGSALGSGFQLGEKEFRELFEAEVRADARQHGLTRRRIGGGMFALLVAAGLPAAALAAATLARDHGSNGDIWVGLGYFAILALPRKMYQGTRLTSPGRAALGEWLGFRAAVTGSGSRPTAATALLAAGGDRRIGYAAALGAAPAAVAAFAADGDWLWSSYGSSWRRVVVGSSQERLVPGVFALLGITIWCCWGASMVVVVRLAAGPAWAAAFVLFPGCIWWGTTWWVFRSAARARQLPRAAQFDGLILKRWTETVSDGDGGSTTNCCVAIDDGQRDQAWSLIVSGQAYAQVRSGMVVHAQVDARRNRLLAMSPAQVRPPVGRP